MRCLIWMPLVVSLSVAQAAAEPIHYSSLAALEASGIGPRIAHRQQNVFTDGRYEDGSVAGGQVPGEFHTDWFSSVYFNGTLYTYAYAATEVHCRCDADYIFNGEFRMLGGALVGATLGDRWGRIEHTYGFNFPPDRAEFTPGDQTPHGFTFGSNEVAMFYLQSASAPADMFGLLSATTTVNGSSEGKPTLVYTMSMDAFVPVPEPGTFVLVSTCLAGALIRRRYQKQKGTIT
jgi:hypothetical protein